MENEDKTTKYVTLENLAYFLEKFKDKMANNGPEEEDSTQE